MNRYRSTWVRASAGAVALLLSGAGVVLGTATAANAEPAPHLPISEVTCGGLTEQDAKAAGYVTYNHAFDNKQAWTIVGTPGPDWMVGGALGDTLDGQGGDDLICGRDGDDDLRGLSGNDQIWGDDGIDTITGGADTDTADGGPQNDVCDATIETPVNC